jgi:vacuolar-type H+-ATPase subunit H
MTPTSDPRHEPEEHEPIAEQAPGDAVDFIDKTVAEITDTEVDEHLHRILSRVFSGRPGPTVQLGITSAFSFDRVNDIMLNTFQKQAADAAAERLQIAWDAATAAREEAEQILADARRQAAETAAQMIDDAREEAEQIIADARAEAERIRASATPHAMTYQAEALHPGLGRFINCRAGIQPPAASTELAVHAAVAGGAAWEPTSVTAPLPAAAGTALTGVLAAAWGPGSGTALADALAAAPLPTGVLTAAWGPGSGTALADALAAAPLPTGVLTAAWGPGSGTALADALAAAPLPTVLTAGPRALAATQGHCLVIRACSNVGYADGPDLEEADGSDTDLREAEAITTRIKQIVMLLHAGEESRSSTNPSSPVC